MKKITNLFILTLLLFAVSSCKNDTNAPHEIIGVTPGIEEIAMGEAITFTCVIDDDDASDLTYQWETTGGGSFPGETNTQSVNWEAPLEKGDCEISVTVSDSEFTDDYSFTVTVKDPEETGEVAVGVYYYPWHGGDDFHGRNYLREHLVPPQLPALGEYNDRESQVIKQHLDWSEYAGIDLWVSSWWGPGRMTDVTMKDYILTRSDLGDMKIALFYETSGRVPDFTDLSNIRSDIEYMADNYFDHPNYFTIEGKAVLFVYLTRVLSSRGVLDDAVSIMRDAAANEGFELYIVGDQVFNQPPSSTDQIALLDAITNYDVYGSSGARIYATQSKVDAYYQAQAGWRTKAHAVNTSFIPATAPGFNDRGVRLQVDHKALSRKLSEDDAFGSLFQAMVDQAVTLVDEETGNLFMVTSWNEWHEDTQIEPVAEAPATSTDDSQSGNEYTNGVEYEGYGTRYLDILKATVSESQPE